MYQIEMMRKIIHRNYSWLQWLGRLWALPNTTAGLLLGLLGKNEWQVHNRTVEVLLRTGPVRWICDKLKISAFTLGDCVLYTVAPCENLREHEGRHSMQYWLLGPLFLPTYFIMLAFWGYWRHPLEKDARTWEQKRCGCLYQSKLAAESSRQKETAGLE